MEIVISLLHKIFERYFFWGRSREQFLLVVTSTSETVRAVATTLYHSLERGVKEALEWPSQLMAAIDPPSSSALLRPCSFNY